MLTQFITLVILSKDNIDNTVAQTVLQDDEQNQVGTEKNCSSHKKKPRRFTTVMPYATMTLCKRAWNDIQDVQHCRM